MNNVSPLNAAAAHPTELLGGQDLRVALGFRSGEAFRAALRSGRIEVPLKKIEGRRGWFARTIDVMVWQASLGLESYPSNMERNPLP